MERITPKQPQQEQQAEDFPIPPMCSEDGCGNDGQHKLMGLWYCNFHATPLFQVQHESFEDFMEQARELVEGRAKDKGYNADGDGKNDLMEFTNKFFPGHASGEVIYKLIRYGRKKNKEDLLKAAAWLYLIWRYDQ